MDFLSLEEMLFEATCTICWYQQYYRNTGFKYVN